MSRNAGEPATISREPVWFWLTAVAVLAAGIGLRDPWPADEPRFALVARQMVESGNWLFPMRGDELYPDKPPLFMWLQAVCYAATGNLRIAFLLPSLLAALGTLGLTRDLARRLWHPQAGAAAGWALLFTLQFTFQAKRAQIDPLLTFWVTLSLWALLRHLLVRADWRLWVLGWMAAGLGVITKGVGVIALFVLLPAVWAQRRGWQGLTTRMRPGAGIFWLGPMAFLLPILAWLLPMLWTVAQAHDPALQAYADNILLRQTATRYARPSHHFQPPWYFLEVIATQWLPTVLATLWLWPRWRERLRERDASVLLLLGWIGLVLLFFTLSPGKREVYVLPALPMLCVALSPWLPALVQRPRVRVGLFIAAVALALTLLVTGSVVALAAPGIEARLAALRGTINADALGWMLARIGAAGLLGALWFGARRGVAALFAVLACLWIGYGVVGGPLLNDASSARGLMLAVGARIEPQAELALVAWKEQNLVMADRPARTFGFLRDADAQLRDARAWQAQAPGTRWILIEAGALDACVNRDQAIAIGVSNRREWWLLPYAASRPGCVPAPTANTHNDED